MAKKQRELGKGGYFIIGMLATALLGLGAFAGYEAYENAQKSASESSTTSQNSDSGGVVASVAEAKNISVKALNSNNLTGSISFAYSVTPKNYKGTITATPSWVSSSVTDDVSTFLTVTNVEPTTTVDGTITVAKLKRMTNQAKIVLTCSSNADVSATILVDDSGAESNHTSASLSSSDFSTLLKNDGSGLTGRVSTCDFDKGSIPLADYTLSSVTTNYSIADILTDLQLDGHNSHFSEGTDVYFSIDGGNTFYNDPTTFSNKFCYDFFDGWVVPSVSLSGNSFTLSHRYDDEDEFCSDLAGQLAYIRIYAGNTSSSKFYYLGDIANGVSAGYFSEDTFLKDDIVDITETFTASYGGKVKTFTAETALKADTLTALKGNVSAMSTSTTSILY